MLPPERPPHLTFDLYFADSAVSVATMESCLHKFPYLQMLVIECEGNIHVPFGGRFACRPSTPRRLQGDKSMWRSCSEARRLAHLALRKSKGEVLGDDIDPNAPISPFWFLANYEGLWERWAAWDRNRGSKSISAEWPYPTVL